MKYLLLFIAFMFAACVSSVIGAMPYLAFADEHVADTIAFVLVLTNSTAWVLGICHVYESYSASETK